MPAPLVVAQLFFLVSGIAMGGSDTKIGGALVLLSFACFGAAYGWAARGRKGGD